MKKYSYPYLISVIVLFLSVIFLFFWWRAAIYRVTFLNPITSRYVILASMAVSFFISVFLVSKGIVKDGKLSAYLKLFGGISIVMVILSVIPVMTITYLLPGTRSSYTAPYEYASGSSRSCSGVTSLSFFSFHSHNYIVGWHRKEPGLFGLCFFQLNGSFSNK